MIGSGMMGFTPKDDEDAPPPPNRAERRAMAQEMKRRKRRGQRAWERRRVLREQAIGELSAAEERGE